jgi:aryl-alcohol dehydrogenase-like predicted oxidoreductase
MASLGDDPDTVPLEETLGALGDLVAQGKIRAIGLSNETSWGVMRAVHLAETMGVPRIVTVQNAYNLLNRYTEINLAEVLMRERIGLLPYSPLAMGVLTGKYLGGARPAGARITLFPHYTRYLTPRGEEATAAYVALAREAGLDPARMALAYVIGRRFVVSTIIGQTSIAQLRNDAEAARLVLPADLVKAIEAIHAANPNPCA